MRSWVRLLSLFTFFAFLSLSVADAYHGHKALPTAQDCLVCKITQNAPALPDRPDSPEPVLGSLTPLPAHVDAPYLLFVFTSHGLSPPLA